MVLYQHALCFMAGVLTMFFARDFKNTDIGSPKPPPSLPPPDTTFGSNSDTAQSSPDDHVHIVNNIPAFLPVGQCCSYDPDRPWLLWPMCYPTDDMSTEDSCIIIEHDLDDDSTEEEYLFVHISEPTYAQRANARSNAYSKLSQYFHLSIWVLLALTFAFAFALVAYSFYKKLERIISILAKTTPKPVNDKVRQLEEEVSRLKSLHERIEGRNKKLEGEDKTQLHEIQNLQAELKKYKDTQNDLSAEVTKLNGDIDATMKDYAAEKKELLRKLATEKRDSKAQLMADARVFYEGNLRQQLEKFSLLYKLDKVELIAAHTVKIAAVQADLKHSHEKLKDCENGRSKVDDTVQAQRIKDLENQIDDNQQAATEQQANTDQKYMEVVQWLEMFRGSIRRSWLECQGINTTEQPPKEEDFDETEIDARIAGQLPSEIRDQVLAAHDPVHGQNARGLKTMEKKVHDVEEQLKCQEEEIQEKDKQLQAKEGEVNGMSQEVEKLEQKIERLEDLVRSKNDQLDRHEQQSGAPTEGFKLDDSEDEEDYDHSIKTTRTSDTQIVKSAVETQEQEIRILRQKLAQAEMDLQGEKNRVFGLTWQAESANETIQVTQRSREEAELRADEAEKMNKAAHIKLKKAEAGADQKNKEMYNKLKKAEAVHDRRLKKAEAVHDRKFQSMVDQVTEACTLLSTALDVRARTEKLLRTSFSDEDKLSRLGRVKFLADGTVILSDPAENPNDQQLPPPAPRTDRKGTFGVCDHCRKFGLPCDRKLECETCKDSGRQCTRNESAVGTDSRTRKAVSEDCDLCRATYAFDHNGTEGIEEVQPIPIICDGEAQCGACTQKGQACKRLGHNVGAEDGPPRPQIQRQSGWGNLRAEEKTVYTKPTDAGTSKPPTPVLSGPTTVGSQESAVPKKIMLKLNLSKSSSNKGDDLAEDEESEEDAASGEEDESEEEEGSEEEEEEGEGDYEEDGQDDEPYDEQVQDGGDGSEKAEDEERRSPSGGSHSELNDAESDVSPSESHAARSS